MFTQRVERELEKIRAYLSSRGVNKKDWDTVIGRALGKLEKRKTFDTQSIYNAARDAVKHLLVQKKRVGTLDHEHLMDVAKDMESTLIRYLRISIEDIPEEQKAVINLYLQGYSFEEIGKMQNISHGQAWNLWKAGISTLRKLLGVAGKSGIENPEGNDKRGNPRTRKDDYAVVIRRTHKSGHTESATSEVNRVENSGTVVDGKQTI